MELRQMRYFVAVAEELHFGRAAARLHISTPTLSQQIKAVEREVGAPLLIRHSRGVELTPAGEVLLRAARTTIRAATDTLRETRRAAGIGDLTLRLGLLNGIPGWLPTQIEEILATRIADCRIVVVAGTTVEQLRLLAAGEVDLALVRRPVDPPRGTRVVEVADEELGVLLSAANPLAQCDDVDTADLAGHELMWFPRDFAPGFHDAMMAKLRLLGGHVVLSETTMSHAQLRAALLVRRDVITLSSIRAADPPAVLWRRLRGRPLVATFAAAWRIDSRNPALRALVPEVSRARIMPSEQHR